MTTAIEQLEPQDVWHNFDQLNRVPRASKKEERVIGFMLGFGRSLGLETLRDEAGNVLIRKAASPGMEGRKIVTLQAHLDMVHQKNAATAFDFEKQGIRMYVDGDWVKARGTTLGADNGMGVAAIMGVLASTEIAHPPLEALFTIDEETGMTGAKGLKPGILKGEILLNLDTEEDDEIDIGCAGGLDITALGRYAEEHIPAGFHAYTLRLGGLRGGHSGMDIHRGLGNANKLMNRLLFMAMEAYDLGLVSIDGGGLRNAIPRESVALFVVPESERQSFEEDLDGWAAELQKEYVHHDPGMQLVLESAAMPSHRMRKGDQLTLLRVLAAVHNGVYRMSPAMEGLVEASNNLARVAVQGGEITLGCLARSSVDSVKLELTRSLASVFELAGYEVQQSGDYPGWSPNPDSEILQLLRSRYESLFQESPRVVACHAGLECGILGNTYPGLDMISFGPTIRGAHSPDERVQVSSVRKFWTLLLDVLAHIPEKQGVSASGKA